MRKLDAVLALVAVLALFLLADFADAGPLGIFGRRSSQACSSGSCGPAAVAVQSPMPPELAPSRKGPDGSTPPTVAVVVDAPGVSVDVEARPHRLRGLLSRIFHRRGSCR